ncbi:hypothetical protein SDC9_176240 [bioreactor metagenome]|uniref:Uncharacterized protein n=1 Tax=bioreactor metagenome TaxID=1076179 RepID=A0A645GQ43_9ZZZZ
MGNKGLVNIVAGLQLTFHHAWNIGWNVAVMTFCAYPGGILKMRRLFIFFVNRLHTVAAHAKLGRTG